MAQRYWARTGRYLARRFSASALVTHAIVCLLAQLWLTTATWGLTFTGSGDCVDGTFTIPAAVTAVRIIAIGRRGWNGYDVPIGNALVQGGAGGFGSVVDATVAVTPGTTLYVNAAPEFGFTDGWSGGQAGGLPDGGGASGGPGGSAAWVTTTDPTTGGGCNPTNFLVVAAGGGGGGGAGSSGSGGAGGMETINIGPGVGIGQSGIGQGAHNGGGGGRATQSAGGAGGGGGTGNSGTRICYQGSAGGTGSALLGGDGGAAGGGFGAD